MAASLATVTKFSFKYTTAISGSTVSRTISGLNISGGSGTTTGPNRDSAINNLYTTLGDFTSGEITNVSWVAENQVVFS